MAEVWAPARNPKKASMVADPRLNTHTGRICNHMNVDHVHTVLAMARLEWPAAQRASLTEVTETGVAIVAARGGERRELAIAFKPPAKDMMEARSRLTALHHEAIKPTFAPRGPRARRARGRRGPPARRLRAAAGPSPRSSSRSSRASSSRPTARPSGPSRASARPRTPRRAARPTSGSSPGPWRRRTRC